MQNPAADVNPLNYLFLWYTRHVFWKCRRRKLKLDDIYDCLPTDESEYLGDRLEKEWKAELEKQKKLIYKKSFLRRKSFNYEPSLKRALDRLFFWQNLILTLLHGIKSLIIDICLPIFMGLVIRHLDEDPEMQKKEYNNVLLEASCMVLLLIVGITLKQHGKRLALLMSMRARVACCTLIHNKSLQLAVTEWNNKSGENILNLMTDNPNSFDIYYQNYNFIWIMPVQIIIITYIMWDKIGPFILLGIFVLLILSFIINSIVFYTKKDAQLIINRLSKERTKLIKYLISEIKILKMYAWEKSFEMIVSQARLSEMRKIVISTHTRGILVGSMIYAGRLAVFLILISLVLGKYKLSAETSFVLVVYFNTLRWTILHFAPEGLISAYEIAKPLKLTEKFLRSREAETTLKAVASHKLPEGDKIQHCIEEVDDENYRPPIKIDFLHASATEVAGGDQPRLPTLDRLTFGIEAGSFCCAIGETGSGKTALLNLILRELPLARGSVSLGRTAGELFTRKPRLHSGFQAEDPKPRISYASQKPWSFPGSVRDNIVFGQSYSSDRYNEMLKVCALQGELENLAEGDQTSVDKLTSDLQALVNLARAVYRTADLYLLDDCLNDLDYRFQRHVFDHCLYNFLQGKTRIVVTNNLEFLQQADSVIVLKQGRLTYFGALENMYLSSEATRIMMKLVDDCSEKNTNDCFENSKKIKATVDFGNHDESSIESLVEETEGRGATSAENNEGYKEHRDFDYWTCLRTFFRVGCSWYLISFVFTILVLSQLFASGADFWLPHWIESDQSADSKNVTVSFAGWLPTLNSTGFLLIIGSFMMGRKHLSTNDSVYVYASLLLICMILTLFKNYMSIRVCFKSCRRCHQIAFSNLLHTTIDFFHKNLPDRISKRFSKDTEIMDRSLPINFTAAAQSFFTVIGILTILVIVDYWLALLIIKTIFVVLFLKTMYFNVMLDVKKLETATKIPVLRHASSTLRGLATIRSSSRSIYRTRQNFHSVLNKYTGARWMSISVDTAFELFLNLTLAAFFAAVVYKFALPRETNFSGAEVGLALSQALALTSAAEWGFKNFAQAVLDARSIRRIVDYTKNLPNEEPGPSVMLPQNWPRRGRIVFGNVSVRNEDALSYSLKNLNLTVESGWKVGIVGDEDAGCSLIVDALFRLVSDGNYQGQIRIDGVNIKNIGLHDLRSHLSIIPQDATLFPGSLRFNLDPAGRFDDSALLGALREVELGHLPLDYSAGLGLDQRLLVCLARALLLQNSVLVLHEPRDDALHPRTNAILRNTIRRRFDRATVLTVARRLNNVIDCDRIVVMENGVVAELGCPHELLSNNPGGRFARLVARAGEEAGALRKLAEESCLRNVQQRSLDISSSDSEPVYYARP